MKLHETKRKNKKLRCVMVEKTGTSSSQLQSKILNQFDVKISESCLNNFRASVSLTRLPAPKESAPKEEKYERNKSSRGEILTCLAFSLTLLRYTLEQ
jgi:hypothetical protein